MNKNVIKLTLIALTLGLLTGVFILGCGSEIDREYALKGDPGANGKDGADGKDGQDGQDGIDGTNGTNGHNSLLTLTRGSVSSLVCVSLNALLVKSGVDANDNNVLDNSEVNAASFVCDGQTGSTGPQGPQGPAGPTGTYQIVSIIDPCGNASGIYDEVLLKLANGTIIASFSDNASGLNTHFAIIPAGSYVTTDGSNCHFSVDGSGNVSW